MEFADARVRQNEEYLENKNLTSQHMVECGTKQGKFQRGSSCIPQPRAAQKSDFPQDKISEVERAEQPERSQEGVSRVPQLHTELKSNISEDKRTKDVRVVNKMAVRELISNPDQREISARDK